MDSENETKNYDKVKYQFSSVASSGDAHQQGKVTQSLYEDTEAHIKQGETLNILCSSLLGLRSAFDTTDYHLKNC